jgi:hypothetical protein
MLPLILAGTGVLGNVISGIGAGKQQRAAAAKARDYERQLSAAEANRQEIINPYEGVRDLSSMINNPFANLQVATKAAEMQAQQSDIALASTLDTLRAGGVGAGGATALAQAALQSKQGIASSIEQQEAQNAQLRAQGEQQMQQIQMQEAARMQEAQVAGKQFVFGATEQREAEKLDRLQGMTDRYSNQAAQFQQAKMSAFGSAMGDLAGLGMGIGEAGGLQNFLGRNQ